MTNKFGEFLYLLRKEKGLTQAELADMLGITNKAISKWETGESFPETAQLLPLSNIFSVTVDELLKGQRNESIITKTDATEIVKPTLKPMTKLEALGSALSIALILAGVFCIVILSMQKVAYHIAVPVMLFIVALGVFFLILINMRKSIKSVDIEPDDYIKAFRCILMIAGGVFLIICAAALMIGLSAFGYKYGLIAFFSILIVAIFLMVFGGISWDIFNKKYTLPSGDSAHHSVKAKKLEETICGVIMLLATATFFLLGFVWEKWHPGWVVFPIGGILCAIVSTILKGVDSTKS